MDEQKKIDKVVTSILNGTEKDLGKKYASTLKKIRGELAELSAKYKTLTWTELQKYDRFTKLEGVLSKHLATLNTQTRKALYAAQEAAYKESFYRTAFAIQKDIGVQLSYKLINPNTIEAAITNPLVKGSLSKLNATLRGNVNQAITQGLLQGKSYRDISLGVKDAMQTTANHAMTIARTETHRCQNKGSMDSAEVAQEQGVKFKKVWVSTLDGNTRDSHQSLDGEKRDLDEAFSNGLQYPGDPAGGAAEVINCRCTTIQEVVGHEIKQRRSRDEGMIENITYKEYAKKKGWA